MPTSSPFISVIIPVFNSEPYLVECIESVLGQVYENWEMILVDDGSTDESLKIARKYAQLSPGRIKCLTHPKNENKGVCASRNLGIRNAKGEYVAFLDSDDVWTNKKLQSQANLIKKFPRCAMFCEASLYWHSWNQSGKEDKIVHVGVPPGRVYHPPQLLTSLYPLTKGAAPCPSGILLKKIVLEQIGAFEEKFVGKYSFYEDQAFLFKVYLSETVFVSDSCNNFYRIRAGSAMEGAKNKENYKRVRHFFLKWAKAYLKHKKVRNQEVNALLEKALRPFEKSVLHRIYSVFKNQV